MRLFAKEGIKNMIGKLGLKDGEAIQHKILDNAIEDAQKRVEERNFEIRKKLLEYDDVLNEERNFIYSERDKILVADDLMDRIVDNTAELIDEAAEAADGDTERFLANCRTVFSSLPEGITEPEALKEAMVSSLRDKESKVGKEAFNSFIRYVYLRDIDRRWIAHLDALEDLRDAASLMSYAQKNPLVEYKNTASDAFDQMISSITENVCRTVNAVRISMQPRRQQPAAQKMEARHASLPNLRTQGTAVSSQAQAQNTTYVRSQPKVGRNDPCPCGSGKKYKHCCGKNL